MSLLAEQLARLAASPICGYRPDGPARSEPTAWAAAALAAHGRPETARPALDWIARAQADDGSVGLAPDLAEPGWPTAWAVLAWQTAGGVAFAPHVERALAWLLRTEGRTLDPKSHSPHHDTSLVGWSWAAGTHSWLEPTALGLLALRAVRQEDNPRARAAVDLLFDRLLPGGGANYGNTIVLGNTLRPHAQPSGLAMWALAGEPDRNGRLSAAIGYLRGALQTRLGTPSFCYAMLGLRAQGIEVPRHAAWVEEVGQRLARPDASPLARALWLLAAAERPLVSLPHEAPAP